MSIFERRQKFHNLYAQHSGLVNASPLGHLHPDIQVFSKESLVELCRKLGLWKQKDHELHPQDRLDRTKALMWLVDQTRIEEEISPHFGATLNQQNLLRLLRPLEADQKLPTGSVLNQIDNKRITIQIESEFFDFRPASGWTDSSALRFIPIQAIPAAHSQQLKRDTQVLRKRRQRNISHRNNQQIASE